MFSVVVRPSRVQLEVAGIRGGGFATHLFFVSQLFLLVHMNWFTLSSMVYIDVSGFVASSFFMGFSISMTFTTTCFVDVSASVEGEFGL